MSASLVVGGSGMLSEATFWLAARSSLTLLAARRASRFAASDAAFLPIDVDWNSASFCETIRCAMEAAPPIGRALIWLHEPERRLPPLLDLLTGARVVVVLGSTDGRPAVPAATAGTATVRLGSMPTARGRRWLTHEEISKGAIAALQDGRSRVVGELAPLG